MSPPASRWSEVSSGSDGERYAAQFARLAASGADVHGEATLCASLVPTGSRVLDAGCGKGRVAVRLAELGYECVGLDSDTSMLAQAMRASDDVSWLLGDLAALDRTAADLVNGFHLVVAAGNVVPLLADGTEERVVAALAAALLPGGVLVAGFGLDADHVPLTFAPVDLRSYDGWCTAAGLVLEQRLATWSGGLYDGGGYAVSVHRRPT